MSNFSLTDSNSDIKTPLKYKILEFKHVDISQLEHYEIRSEDNIDQSKISELQNSQKYFAALEPLLVRANGHGKYKVLDGNRRLAAMQKLGLTTNIPVNVVEMSDEDLKLVALVKNYCRADMHPDDIAKALISIYERRGFDLNTTIRNLHNMRAKIKVDPEFEDLCKSLGMSKMQQTRYLIEYRDINPETKKVLRDAEIGKISAKVRFLAHPEIRRKPQVQTAVARIIKEMTTSEAKNFCDDVKEKRVTLREGLFRFNPGSGVKSTNIRNAKDAKQVQLEGSFGVLGIETAVRLIEIFTKEKEADVHNTQQVIDNSRPWRLASMKRMDVTMLNKMSNYLMLLEELIQDTLTMIERETESRKQKDVLTSA